MEIIFLWNSTEINPWSAYFQLAYFTSLKESQQPVTLMIPHLTIVLTEQNDLVIKGIQNFPKFF